MIVSNVIPARGSSTAPQAEPGRKAPGRLRRLWLVPAALLVAGATWPIPGLTPAAGLDTSWRIALHLAASQGLDFGRDVVFTYGPLGFLASPLLVTAPTGVGAFVFAALGQVALAGAVLLATSRVYPAPLAVVASFAALALPVTTSDLLAYLVFFVVVYLLERGSPARSRWLLPVLGVLSAAQFLIKLNGGLLCLALLALAAWRVWPYGWRGEVVLACSCAAAVVVFWVLTGNAVTELGAWFRESTHVVSGYTDAMALESRARLRAYVAAAILLVGAGILLVRHLLPLERRRAVALGLVGAAYFWVYAKEGFVRHDAHDLYFFGGFAVGILAFRWRGAARWFALALVLGAAAATASMPELGVRQLYRPVALTRLAWDEIRLVASADRVNAAVVSARAAARAQLGIPPSLLRRIDGTVDVVPFETSVVWAYNLRWRPEPILQWYMAYDAYLDEFNARAVQARGADYVLRQRGGAVDGKEPDFEAPATYVALLCRYHEVAATADWLLLARGGNRCGRSRRVATVHARAGEVVRVPAAPPGTLLYARLTIPRPMLDRLAAMLFKPIRLPRIDLGGRSYRFIPATAPNPLVLAVPPSAGLPAQFGGLVAFRTLELHHVPSPFTIEFDALPIRGRPFRPPPPPAGRLTDGALVVGTRRIPLVGGSTQGLADVGEAFPGGAVVEGWAVDARTKRRASRVLVFAGRRLVAVGTLDRPRPDVARAIGSANGMRFGFSLAFAPRPDVPVRVFAEAGGRAAELEYGPGYGLRR